MLKRIASVLASVFFLLLGVSAASAQTTGRIAGKIVDSTAAALPGATVTVSSPSLQGTRTATTDATGAYRFPTLPPGTYVVKADLAGFQTAEQPQVEVGIDRTVEINLTLQVSGVTEAVTVLGASPVIDVASSGTGINARPETFERLPIKRDFSAIAQLAPGTSWDAAGVTVAGSTGAENTFIIEGLNTTGVAVGTQGKKLNFDFVQEIEVKTGGLAAEYGRMTGGAINVITKSGGNTFHGSAFGFAEGGGLQAQNSTADQRPQTTTTVENTSHVWDVGVSLGGFIVEDRLWFYGAYNRQATGLDIGVIRPLSTPGSPAVGEDIPTTVTADLYSAKLTFKLGNNHNLVFSAFGDPSTRDGSVFVIAGPASTWQGTADFGGSDYVGRYDAVFGNTAFLRALVGRHTEGQTIGGAGRDMPLTIDRRVSPNVRSGGFGAFWDDAYTRDVVKADFSKFLGPHELKAGGDYERIDALVDRYRGGAGQSISILQTGGVTFYSHAYYVDDTAPGYDRNDPGTWVIAVPLTSEPGIRNSSIYGQDSWRVSHLTINAGLRWERQQIIDRFGITAADLTNNWAPRLGVVLDPKGNGRSKLSFNYGRFYETIPMDMGIRSFGGEGSATSYNFSPNPASYLPDPTAPRPSRVFSATTPVDPDLQGQRVDEWLLGFEHEVTPGLSVAVRFAYRDLGQVIEDFLIPSERHYFIANPGTGIGKEMAFYDGVHIAPAPKPERKYTSLELSTKKRYSNGWQLLASYVYSKLEGNYDGTYQVSTGQLDPNINSAFDYADFLINAKGPLSNDRRNYIKVDGSYEIQTGAFSGLNVGGTVYWASGYPLNAYGYSFAYGTWEYYLVPRGSLGRGPSEWEASIHVGYPLRLGTQARLEAILDVFHLFNRQAITRYDQRYNLTQDGVCGGIPTSLCNDDGGIATTGNNLVPRGTLANPRATATNPDYLKTGTTFTGQRSARVGFRLTF